MRKILLTNLKVLFFIVLTLQLLPSFVLASAWWGRGAPISKDWVLEHGGTLISYEIENYDKTAQYTAEMYLLGATGAGGDASNKAKKGDLIENESGVKATFDDAINNKYKIKIFEDGDSKMSKEVTARPGEKVELIFDLEKDKVTEKTKVVYAKDEIKLTSESAKYIKLSEIDSKNPVFVKVFPNVLTVTRREQIEFKAEDQTSGVDYYRVKLLDKNGKILRDWRKQTESYYFIPEDVINEVTTIVVRAYDKAGNSAEQKTTLKIVENKTPETLVEKVDVVEEEEKVEENEEQKEQEKEQKTLQFKETLNTEKEKISSLKSGVEDNFKNIENKNFFSYFLFGPDKNAIQKIEQDLKILGEKISVIEKLNQTDFSVDLKTETENAKNSLNEFTEEKEQLLAETKTKTNFWNRLKLLLKIG